MQRVGLGASLANETLRLPAAMSESAATEALRAAYASVDDGKLLRRLNRRLRRQGIDPPMHVQYVAEPHVEPGPSGWEVHIHPDILIYEEFPEMEDCIAAFEAELLGMLTKRLRREEKRWSRAHRP